MVILWLHYVVTLCGNTVVTLCGNTMITLHISPPLGETDTCAEVTVDNAVVTASTAQPVASGVTITVTCNSNYQITGTTDTAAELTCSGTSFSGATPTCSFIGNG